MPPHASPFINSRSHIAGVVACGLWLLAAPVILRIDAPVLKRADQIAGLLLIGLALSQWRRPRLWLQAAEGAIGLWLPLAPLVFWAPESASYLNDTVTGILVVVFAVMLPYSRETGGPEIPPGWSYNPSAWHQRIPILSIGMAAYGVAAYMAAFQLGYLHDVWDPFFGEGTKNVLHSDVSKAFPVSDAGLGAATYLIEALAGLMGDPRRWRTMPWIVLLFGFLVVPAGIVSIILVILQPSVVGAWCTLCLVSAVLCLATIPPAIDEIVASSQFLLDSKRRGKSILKTLFVGEVFSPETHPPVRQPTGSWLELTLPWNLVVSALLGLSIMAVPALGHFSGPLANGHYLTGALITTFAVTAMAEAGRSARWLNMLFGFWLVILPWVLDGPVLAKGVDTAVGVALLVLTPRRGKLVDRHGAWDRYVV